MKMLFFDMYYHSLRYLIFPKGINLMYLERETQPLMFFLKSVK